MLTKNLARYGAVLFAALCAFALLLTPLVTVPKAHSAGLPTDQFKAKTPGIPDSTIQTISDFDLNKAKVVGGSAPVADSISGATAITSPDGNFKLIQGTRMFVEYVNKAAITNLTGGYQEVPGSITLQWDDAAVDKTNGKMIDVQITLHNPVVRVTGSDKNGRPLSRAAMEAQKLYFLMHWQWDDTGGVDEMSIDKDLHSGNITSPAGWYKSKGFSSLSTITWNCFSTTINFTFKFLNKDGSENKGTYNMVTTDIDVAGVKGSTGKWRSTYDRSDRNQEHIKLLTPGDSLHVTKDTVLWTNSDTPKREAWSTKGLTYRDTKGWALSHIRSGSTIEYGNRGGMNLFAQLDPLFSKIAIIKLGDGLTPGQTFPTGTNVIFTYEVKNVGLARVDKIAVTDSKGVKVTCPKTTLNPGESMVCTGTGKVVGSPGFIAPPNPGDVEDPGNLN